MGNNEKQLMKTAAGNLEPPRSQLPSAQAKRWPLKTDSCRDICRLQTSGG